MEATQDNQPSTPLRFARHIVGMMILALASPYIWYSSDSVATWASTWVTPLLIAGVAFGLYLLFFTKRAKEAWPGRFFMLAWVMLALAVAGPYLEKFNRERAQSAASNSLSTPPQTAVAQPPLNHFDQFDTASASSRQAYVSRVNDLRLAGKNGSIPILDIQAPSDADKALKPWSPQDVAAVENTQTWWVDGEAVWMHIMNRSIAKIDALQFTYAAGNCGAAPPSDQASYFVRLQRSVEPGAEALVRFAAVSEFKPANGCLTIVKVLG